MPASHPVVSSSNNAAEHTRATDWSFIMPRTQDDPTVLSFSLNPWRALSSCKLDAWLLNGLYCVPLPKQDSKCVARYEDSRPSSVLFASSASAYQKYRRGALDCISYSIKLMKAIKKIIKQGGHVYINFNTHKWMCLYIGQSRREISILCVLNLKQSLMHFLIKNN